MYFASYIAQVQTYDKARNALALALSPVVKALVDPDGALKDIRDLDSVRIDIIFSCLFEFQSLFLQIVILPKTSFLLTDKLL